MLIATSERGPRYFYHSAVLTIRDRRKPHLPGQALPTRKIQGWRRVLNPKRLSIYPQARSR